MTSQIEKGTCQAITTSTHHDLQGDEHPLRYLMHSVNDDGRYIDKDWNKMALLVVAHAWEFGGRQ